MRSLVLLLILIVACLSSTSVIKKRNERAAGCTKRIPIADYFEYGYDLSEYDVFACPDFGGRRAKFTDLNTCIKGKKFKLGYQTKVEYDVPDQFFRAYESPSFHSSSGHTYHSLDELGDLLTSSVFETFRYRIDGIENAKFKNSQFYSEMRKVLARGSRVPLTYYKSSIVGMDIERTEYNKTFLTPAFVSHVSSLPETLHGSEKTYLDFVQKYGTHIIMHATFGATAYRFAEVRPQEFGRENDINWQMKKDAMALNGTLFQILCEKTSGYRQVLKVHTVNRNFTQVMVGGYADTNLYTTRNIPYEAIYASPALISSEVRPISVLLEENKKTNVEKAIKLYMSKAYIRSKVSAIKVLLKSGRAARNETNELVKKVDESSSTYSEEELVKLGNDLKREERKLDWQ